ncbi:unnamed protein product [Nezara viridula]|uniref:Protein lin-37 homolog n=1 Tax=Nezara viridula TaxID=85310 RepID=A0A9P0H9J6_NEZVI|nr:unnamed protein product [Nezara viridula]
MVKKRRLGSASKGVKSRDRSPQSGDEIISARDRFKGALQDLLPHSDEESDISDEEQWASKSKRINIHKKKQQVEKPPEDTSNKCQQTFVMKMFDRSVDLAQFTENTPLYPICRAWIANQPSKIYNIKKEPLLEIKEEPGFQYPKDENDFDNVRDTYRLPLPDLPVSDIQWRIPDLIQYESKFINMQQEGVEPPSKDEILQDNLAHWSKVRKSWMEASTRNDSRYRKSITILSAMYNKAQRQFQT